MCPNLLSNNDTIRRQKLLTIKLEKIIGVNSHILPKQVHIEYQTWLPKMKMEVPNQGNV